VRVTTGKPADKIVAMARDEGVDLIIMASTGYGTSSGDEDYPFGSTADKVVRRSPVDVHVVRTR
jgi:nucleotide-binding universal stress UspA family protein